MLIEVEGYDWKEMDKIEKGLINMFAADEEAEDFEEFIELHAPEDYKDYLHKSREIYESLEREGIRV